MYINPGMEFYLHIADFNIQPTGYSNNTVGVNMFTFKTIILPFINLFAAGVINKPWKDGPISLECPMKNACLGFLY